MGDIIKKPIHGVHTQNRRTKTEAQWAGMTDK